MKKLYGVTCAMITPFNFDGSVNFEAVKKHCEFLIEKGVDCLYPLGTTGEMYKMSVKERKLVAEAVVKTCAGRKTVFIHTGASEIEDVIDLSLHAYKIGADGVGIITPSFFSLTNEESIHYYKVISNSLPEDFPIYLYHLPQCTSAKFTPGTAETIASECRNVIGIKYSYPDISETLRYLEVQNGQFSVLQGADRLILPVLAMGCDGVVSGCSSAYPEPFVAVKKAWEEGDPDKARRLQSRANRIADILKGGASAAWFKSALEYRGVFKSYMRMPQLDISEREKAAFFEELKAFDEETEN